MKYLLIDADDTLWENNIYFEQAFDNFVDFLDHSALTPVEVRDVLNEIELANSRIHGYGSKNFGRNLQQAYQHLAEREIRPDDLSHIFSLAERILEQPVELIEGVEQTLQFRYGVGSAHGISIELIHGPLVIPAMPTYVKRIHKARRATKVAQQNSTSTFCDARKFSKQIPRLGKMMQN